MIAAPPGVWQGVVMQLRPYQERAIARARSYYLRGRRSVCIVAPTGAGKGTIAATLAVRARGGVLFIVHTREIIRDIGQRMLAAGAGTVGLWTRGRCEGDRGARIHVCGIQTIRDRTELPPARLVIWDECHRTRAASYQAVRERYPGAVHLGMTATPIRGDGQSLGHDYQELVQTVGVPDLIAAGHLTPVLTVRPAQPLDGLAMHPVAAYQRWAPDGRAVVFARDVPTMVEIAEAYSAAGIPVGAVWGDMPTADRDATLRAFASGETRVLCNVAVLTEGWDCPPADTCILARGAGHVGRYLQMVGRVLRPSPDKRRALLIDLQGVSHTHGLPDAARRWTLEGEGNGRAPAASLTTCPQCWAVYDPAPRCPECGREAPPLVADVRLTPAEMALADEERRERHRRAWRQLEAMERRDGRRRGWARWAFRKQYGYHYA